MINMLKNAQNKEEKIKTLEEKRTVELDEMGGELALKKKNGLTEIKDRFNQLAQKVKVDAEEVKLTLKKRNIS